MVEAVRAQMATKTSAVASKGRFGGIPIANLQCNLALIKYILSNTRNVTLAEKLYSTVLRESIQKMKNLANFQNSESLIHRAELTLRQGSVPRLLPLFKRRRQLFTDNHHK